MEDSLAEYLFHKNSGAVMLPSRILRIIQVVCTSKFLAQNNLMFLTGHTCTRKCAFIEQHIKLHIRVVKLPF